MNPELISKPYHGHLCAAIEVLDRHCFQIVNLAIDIDAMRTFRGIAHMLRYFRYRTPLVQNSAQDMHQFVRVRSAEYTQEHIEHRMGVPNTPIVVLNEFVHVVE